MNHWAFVTAAYLVTFVAAAGLGVQSWLAMRAAEAAADSLKAKK
jgi:hypothetical protein